jgi:hypothetical protein
MTDLRVGDRILISMPNGDIRPGEFRRESLVTGFCFVRLDSVCGERTVDEMVEVGRVERA